MIFARVFGTIKFNSVRRKDALESNQMLGVAIHQRSVEIEQERGFHDRRARSAPAPVTLSLRSARA